MSIKNLDELGVPAGIRKLATLHNVGTGTVQRIKDAMAVY